ncbi:MAG: LamG-like jellyroll fold domain-containing protein [Candidatus Heimdallarchaeaceae archaeon]
MAWLGNWKYRRKITIDSSKIDTSDLSHFPVLVYLSSSSGSGSDDVTDIFTELGVNSKKIAFTKSDGTTQLYGEIEKWDNTNNKAWIWVSKDSWTLAHDADTEFYIYYDSSQPDNTTYIGDVGARTEVWDSNFKMVQHMIDATTSTITDSTSNNCDGTKLSANNPIEAAAKIGQGQDFGNDDVITGSGLPTTYSAYTVSAWFKADAYASNKVIFVQKDEGDVRGNISLFLTSSTIALYHRPIGVLSYNTTDTTNWIKVTALWNGSNNYLYINNTQQDSGAAGSLDTLDSNFYIGRDVDIKNYFDGKIDEIRVSNIARAINWRNAEYYSDNDTLIKDYATKEAYSAPSAEDNSVFFGCNF